MTGWRSLDPGTGDEAGTTEGKFDIYWEGDFLYGKNHSIATESNHYLLGYGTLPMNAKHDSRSCVPSSVLLWYSDYHPDGSSDTSARHCSNIARLADNLA